MFLQACEVLKDIYIFARVRSLHPQ
jgi:hypothetical protein